MWAGGTQAAFFNRNCSCDIDNIATAAHHAIQATIIEKYVKHECRNRHQRCHPHRIYYSRVPALQQAGGVNQHKRQRGHKSNIGKLDQPTCWQYSHEALMVTLDRFDELFRGEYEVEVSSHRNIGWLVNDIAIKSDDHELCTAA